MSAIFSSAEPENQELITRINDAVGRRFFKPGKCALSKDALPFYREACRLRATSFSTLPNVTKTFVFDRENVMAMDGTSEAVSEANELFGLHLDLTNVTAYVSFFFSCLRTAEGRFRLIQAPEDIPFSVPVDDSLIQVLDELLSPASAAEEKEGYLLDGFVLYGSTLYKARIAVSSAGEVNIRNEEAVYDELPVQKTKLR